MMIRLFFVLFLLLATSRPVLAQSALSTSEPALPVLGMAAPNSPGPDYFALQRKKIFRWNDQTRYIMVYIADGSYLPGWNPENPARVREAFAEWEQAMAPRFHFIYMPDERGSDVKVQWATVMEHNAAGETAGTNEMATWGQYICKNDIKLTLMHPNGRLYTPNLIQSVALHEIGHMLGLKGHSDYQGDVMYPSTDVGVGDEVQHLSPRDINTLRLVYQSKPDYSNPEGYHLANSENFKKTQHGRRMTLMWIPLPGVPFPVPIILPF
jgi:hypothetical protein